ncbi:MAG TPA: hypothetical protein VE129_09805 [Thermoanaerobaculia bacterium]|nr:hypothetical protein [Thermoanaerobaculia bacterium]
MPYPRAVVTRAVWDDDAKALVLTMVPGTDAAEKVAFSVRNLDPSATWQITRDGVRMAALEQGVVKGSASPADVTWADGILRVTTGLRGEETFVVAKRAGD